MTMDRTAPASGDYVLDVPYTWSYFEYQNPLRMSFVANLNGWAAPSVQEPFSYCDLGCGNGVSANLLAAMYPQGTFHGVDFNAEHIDNAKRLAEAGALTNTRFVDAAFADYADDDPPQFDFIVMHGIYSWVSADVREQILTLVDRTLKPGGLLYVCYNTLPGWSELIPLWRMMQSYLRDERGSSIDRAKGALARLAQMRDAGAPYFRDQPSASRYLDRLMERDINYVAHEFCNQIFEPMYFRDVAQDFGKLDMAYAGTMKLHRNERGNVLSPKLIPFTQTDDPIEAEARTSLLRNEFFRRDLYIRDGLALSERERRSALGAYRYAARPKAKEVDRKAVSLGRRTFDASRSDHGDLLSVFEDGSRTLQQAAGSADVSEERLQALIDLVGAGLVEPVSGTPVREDRVAANATVLLRNEIDRAYLCETLEREGKCYVTQGERGCAARVDYLEGRLLLAMHDSTFDAAFRTLRDAARKGSDGGLLHHGYTADGEGMAKLERRARRFLEKRLPRLAATGVVSVEH